MRKKISVAGTLHPIESVLSRRAVQWLLGVLCRTRGFEKSLFERFCENYNHPGRTLAQRLWWLLPELLVDFALKRAKLNKRLMTEKLFHHRPTVRALALSGRSVARHGLSAPQRFAAPLMVVWNITRACNLLCRHCYQNAAPRPEPNELTLDEKLRAVDQMGLEGVPFLAIAGGEPLVSKDLWPVLERARERGIHTTVATNGTLLTKENAERLIEAGVKYVEVSIDSAIPEEHDRFRGRAGAWERSIEGIRNSVAAGMRTGLAACFTRRNVETVDRMVDLAVRLGCRTFSHFNFIPVGRGKQLLEDDLTPAQREWLLRKLVGHLQEGRIGVISTAPQFGRACVTYAPPEGIFATANTRPAAPCKHFLARDWVDDARWRRIMQLLRQRPQVSIADCQAIQTDLVSLPARDIAGRVSELLQSALSRSAEIGRAHV